MMRHLAASLLVACCFSMGVAQTAQEKPSTLYLRANVGSFKMVDGQGTATISFSGTLLIVGLNGTATPSGGLKLEYDDRNRKAYFGTGSIVIKGRFRGVQWFGRNLNAKWTGLGLVRLMGEFDDQLKVGEFWYEGDEKRDSWLTGGRTIYLPDKRLKAPKPIEKGG